MPRRRVIEQRRKDIIYTVFTKKGGKHTYLALNRTRKGDKITGGKERRTINTNPDFLEKFPLIDYPVVIGTAKQIYTGTINSRKKKTKTGKKR